MHQAVTARQNGHERTEVHQSRDASLIDAADFHIGGDQFDAPLGFLARGTVHRCDLHRAVIFDVDGGTGFLGDLADDRTTPCR